MEPYGNNKRREQRNQVVYTTLDSDIGCWMAGIGNWLSKVAALVLVLAGF